MVALYLGSQSTDPWAIEHLVGRFDCRVQSDMYDGGNPHRQIISFQGWYLDDAVLIERISDDHAVRNQARGGVPHFTDAGTFNVGATTGIGVVVLEQTEPGGSTFRLRGGYVIPDAGRHANEWGICEASIRQAPATPIGGAAR
jgi:hypothetical protein